MNHAERRSYFRVTDSIALRYRVIEASQLPDSVEEFNRSLSRTFSLASDFAATRQQNRNLLQEVKNKLPEAALYMEQLENKLDMLVQVLMATGEELPGQPTHHVDISATGIGFETAHPLPEGTLLELRLLFFPSYFGILSYGRVVNCRPAEDSTQAKPIYRIGIEFSLLRDSDRETLIQHIVQKQVEHIRHHSMAEDPAVEEESPD